MELNTEMTSSDSAGLHELDIDVTPFKDGDRPFKIRLPSPDVMAEGSSAALLKGKMLVSRSQPDAVDVALKVFRLPLNSEQKGVYLKMYANEVEAARLGASERYILPYLGTSVLGYQPVIVSQYMRHGNLLDYFVHNDVDRQAMLLQVAEALAFLHIEAGMVHGDLKCENVLVADDGTPRLADFGLSTLVDKAATAETTDDSIRVRNTVRFAAPELLADYAKSVSGRTRSKTTQSDVWAFGMLVVQAFTSNHPWPGFDNQVVALKTLQGVRHPRPGDDATLRGLSDSWWDICIHCWAIAPEDRPAIDQVLVQLCHATPSSHSFYIKLAQRMGRLSHLVVQDKLFNCTVEGAAPIYPHELEKERSIHAHGDCLQIRLLTRQIFTQHQGLDIASAEEALCICASYEDTLRFLLPKIRRVCTLVGTSVGRLRAMVKRNNGSLRPGRSIAMFGPTLDMTLPELGTVFKNFIDNSYMMFYMEPVTDVKRELPIDSRQRLIFLKHFDIKKQSSFGIRAIYVNDQDKLDTIRHRICRIMRWTSVDIEMREEIRGEVFRILPTELTVRECNLGNGDIIVFNRVTWQPDMPFLTSRDIDM